MDIFDKFLIRGVKIIFWKGPSLVMEERQLLGEVMLKYPLLFSLLPESSRENTMEFLKKKMLELGVQTIDELNCFRVMNGHLYWEMIQQTPLTDFELALEEFLFRERLESAVKSLTDKTQAKSNFSDISDKLQDIEVSPVTMKTEHFQITNKFTDTRFHCRDITENGLSTTIHCNHSNAEDLKGDGGSMEEYSFGLDNNGSGKGFQDFKVEKHFHLNDDYQNDHRAIKFPPVEDYSSCNERGEQIIRNDFNNRDFSSVNNHVDCSRGSSSYRSGNQQFCVRNGPIFLNEKHNGNNDFQF